MFRIRHKFQKVIFSMLLISAIIVGGISTCPILSSNAAATPIKIMCIGDSCTEGMGDPNMGSYRTELYNLYKKAGINFDFVGSNQKGPSTLPDRDNEGHSGWTIPQVASNVNNWLNAQNPDVILLWIGGNDMILNGNLNTTGLSNLIDQILNQKPNVTIFVSDYYPVPDQIKQYNAVIPGVVQQKANAGKKVYFNKMSSMNFVRSTDLSSDGLHLSVAGYVKAANIWYNTTIDTLKSMSGSNSPTVKPSNTPTPTAVPSSSTSPVVSPITRPIKIMPVGDSCTEGMGDPNMGSYRTELYNLYKKAGINFDFVGSNQRGPSTLPDRDNEGHSGWTIPQVANNINNWLNAQNPDVVLLWIGGNDLLQGGKTNPTGLSNLIDQIIQQKPNIKIFVSDYYPVPDSVTKYNSEIPGVIQQKVNEGKSVYFNKMSSMNFVRSTDLSSDGLHLNVNGYIKAANIWYNSTIDILKSMSGSNSPTNTPTNTPTPSIINPVPQDVNGDRVVNMADVILIASRFNAIREQSKYDVKCDLNSDGVINMSDVIMIASKFNYTY
ncbi:GDSL-type esterase/lipase family protein [Pseudobacteroides cellulosolvens]|uniref:SGNH hydrolase-type esterase domain-containing protein n=1 Tax=Pseudobacteroides cellulosolvens ATCC 35603 = DSM 2933 TaxID=398512 RepID=A0A0L6JQ38_9FIRM|nr:GDSL-type esterase/lipase family protein [Pseudobacteroides cellulosolvens]KNY27800.1 hypothetical protein Bccel_3071 [Pseudobacteroides cellulosolvens ATCC 35603 = DSM 2933]